MPSQPVAQVPDEAQSPDHAECGKLAAQSIVQAALGHLVALNIPDNANAEQIAAGINAVPGMHAGVSWSDVNALQASEYSQGHWLIVGVNCTGNCVLVPYVTGIRHWVAGYLQDHIYNCWGSTYETDPLESDHNSQMGTVIVWADQTTGGGIDLANVGAGFFQGLAVFLSGGLLGRTREGESAGTVNLDAAVAGDLLANPDDFINQVHAVTGSDEFNNLRVGIEWLMANLTDGKGNVDPARLAAVLGTGGGGGVTMDQVKAEIAASRLSPG